MTSKARTTEDDGKVTKVDRATDTVEPAATRRDWSLETVPAATRVTDADADAAWDRSQPHGDDERTAVDDEPDPNAVTTRLDNIESALRLHGLMP